MTKNELIGTKIVELFKLPKLRKESKLYRKAYYPTSWGSKTLEGLGACVQRITKESEYFFTRPSEE